MYTNKIMQLNYQDFGFLVEKDSQVIQYFQTETGIVFDCVVAKLRNGTIPGAILANLLHLPLSVIEINDEISFDNLYLPEQIRNKEKINILFVDSICGTGRTIEKVKKFFKDHPQFLMVSYCTLVDKKAINKPDICGIVEESFIQPPWDWNSFTPQSNIARLEADFNQISTQNTYCLGFSSKKTKEDLEMHFSKNMNYPWSKIFEYKTNDENNIISASQISTVYMQENSNSIQDYKGIYKDLIKEKVNFIQLSGITHFIETNLPQSILIATECPVCYVLYFDGTQLHRIYSYTIPFDIIDNLKF